MKSTVLAAAFAAISGSAAFAVPIAAPGTEGFSIFAGGGEVIARYEGTSAAYTNLLFLDNGDADFSNDTFVFNNQLSPVGATFNLGSFTAGTELIFRLFVSDTGDNFFSGPAFRNLNGQPHNRAETAWLTPGVTLVSFEDLFGGPFDYNDLSFSFSNTFAVELSPIPLPATGLLLLGALGGLAAMRRKKAMAA